MSIIDRMAGFARVAGHARVLAGSLLATAVLAAVAAAPGCYDKNIKPRMPDAPVSKSPGIPGVSHYRLVILQPLYGDIASGALAINDASPAEIAGFSTGGNHKRRAVKWRYDDGILTSVELPPLPDYENAVANDINDLGVACGGCSHRVLGNRRPVVWTGLMTDDIYSLAHQIPGESGEATAIANTEQVVGWYWYRQQIDSDLIERPFTYFRGTLNDCHAQYSTNSRYSGIDALSGGGAVGYSYSAGPEPNKRAIFISDVVDWRHIPGIGEGYSEAFGVAYDKDARRILVAGSAEDPAGGKRPFFWEGTYDENMELAGQATLLGNLSALEAAAYSVNTHRIVVGSIMITPSYVTHVVSRAFIWSKESGLLDLGGLLSPDSRQVSIYGANDINENGWIVGSCRDGGNYLGCLLIPEPAEVVEMWKSGPGTVIRDGLFEYAFIVMNPTDENAQVTITDPLPQCAVFDENIEQPFPWTLRDGTLSLEVEVPAGGSVDVRLILRASCDPGEIIENTGYAFALNGHDPVVAGDRVRTLIVEPPILIDMAKAGPGEVVQGGVLEYVFTVENRSPVGVDVTITDPVPAGAAFDPALPQVVPWVLQDGIVSVTVAVAAGESKGVALAMRAVGEAGATVTDIGYAYRVGDDEPVVFDLPVRTRITSPSPDVIFPDHPECRELASGENVAFEPDLSEYGGVVERVEFSIGPDLLGTDTEAPFIFEWENVPPGVHPVRMVAFSGGAPVHKAFLVVLIVDVHERPAVCYEMTDLQAPEGRRAIPMDINDRGVVAGFYSRDMIGDSACIWTESQPEVLCRSRSRAHAISEEGLVGGLFSREGEEMRGPFRPCLFHGNGVITEIPIPGCNYNMGDAGCVEALRDNGQAVVSFSPAGTCNTAEQNGVFIYQDGITHMLAGPDGSGDYDLYSKIITRQGHVIGDYYSCSGIPGWYPFIWQAPGHLSELQTESSPVGRFSGELETRPPQGANNTGYALGYWKGLYRYDTEDVSVEADYHEFDFGPVGCETHLSDINDFVMICGKVYVGNDWRGNAFLYVCGHMLILDDLVALQPGVRLESACCINNGGVIAGRGSRDGARFAFKLTPIR